jgi:hypothetical protein
MSEAVESSEGIMLRLSELKSMVRALSKDNLKVTVKELGESGGEQIAVALQKVILSQDHQQKILQCHVFEPCIQ